LAIAQRHQHGAQGLDGVVRQVCRPAARNDVAALRRSTSSEGRSRVMQPLFTMRQALADPLLLADAMKGESWAGWRVLLTASVGEELTADERLIFKAFTGRDHEPGTMIDTWLTVSGRRSGKTTAVAVLVVYLSCLCDWSGDLNLGERGTALYLAPTQDQAGR